MTQRSEQFRQAIQKVHPQSLTYEVVQDFQSQMINLLNHSGEQSLSRIHPKAHFTCSAFIFSEQAQCLALFHKKLQRWLQPGGHVELQDSTPLEAALREAQEESHLSDLLPLYPFPIDLDIHIIPARKDEPEHFHYDLRYALLTKVPQEAMLSEESTGLTWLDQKALQSWQKSDDSIGRAISIALSELIY